MESNQLGKSIVNAALILAVAAILCVSLTIYKANRYTPLGNSMYLDQQSGKTYSVFTGKPVN